MAKKKYYVVWRGHNIGVFDNWDEAKLQTEGFEGARFKSYPTEMEAREAFKQGPPKITRKATNTPAPTAKPIIYSIAVDAACSGNPGVMEYRGVTIWNNLEVFHLKCELGTNNIGEFLAIVHALAMLKKRNDHTMPIYTDSKTAISWVRQKKCKTKLDQTPRTLEVFNLIQRAEAWLNSNTWSNPIIKWPTEEWGEIPADFGRK